MSDFTSLENVLETTSRIPLTKYDGEVLLAYLRMAAKNGLDVNLHVAMRGAFEEISFEGVVVLSSAFLGTDFVFVKVNAGRGFFGGQKSRVLSFVGTVDSNELVPGTAFRSLATAVTSINNIFRQFGVLRGPAL